MVLIALCFTGSDQINLRSMLWVKNYPQFISSSVQSLDWLGHWGDMWDHSAEILSNLFSAGGHCEQFWHGKGCPLFDVVNPAFPPPAMVSPTLQGALKDGFGQAVVVRDIPKTCKFPSLDICQMKPTELNNSFNFLATTIKFHDFICISFLHALANQKCLWNH